MPSARTGPASRPSAGRAGWRLRGEQDPCGTGRTAHRHPPGGGAPRPGPTGTARIVSARTGWRSRPRPTAWRPKGPRCSAPVDEDRRGPARRPDREEGRRRDERAEDQHEAHRGTGLCVFAGDRHQGTATEAQQVLDEALGGLPEVLPVDLSGVELLASGGLNALLRARTAAADRTVPVVLVAPSAGARRLLEVTEAAGLPPVHGTVEGGGPAQRGAARLRRVYGVGGAECHSRNVRPSTGNLPVWFGLLTDKRITPRSPQEPPGPGTGRPRPDRPVERRPEAVRLDEGRRRDPPTPRRMS
ncbi:STAS domain-containing protein [Kitasatospora sp. DSM 101779]|uniref:STAS domain-containing protein n=1 Tax=Kitasatospora sp. DSM 101779 TaxID=2853165 RepID=UPI003985D25F